MERETKKSLNIEQIQQIIPHRHPFCLIDRIEDYEPGEFAIGYKAVTYTEEFFKGHFPNKPVMPGGTYCRSACTNRSSGDFKYAGK